MDVGAPALDPERVDGFEFCVQPERLARPYLQEAPGDCGALFVPDDDAVWAGRQAGERERDGAIGHRGKSLPALDWLLSQEPLSNFLAG